MKFLPPARIVDVLTGRAKVVGSRLDPDKPRGLVSPVEARVLLGIPYGDMKDAEAAYLNGDRSLSKDAALLMRTLFARATAADPDAPAVPRPHIVAADVHNITIEEAVDIIFADPPKDRARMVHFVHPHALNLAAFDEAFRTLLGEADLVLPDGFGLRLAARMLGVRLEHNVNGTDLLPLLCARSTAGGTPLILIGGAEGVAEACAENLRASYPGLRIPFVSHGFLNEDAIAAAQAEVRKHPRAIVLLGMGSPLQERWAHQHLRPLAGTTAITVGGLFDFFSGRIPRAPIAWRESGMEWAWRLTQEPTRLAKRYLVGNPLFLALAAKQRITKGKSRP